jgi:hypothetical protein
VADLIDPGALSDEDWEKYLEGFEENGFEVYAKWSGAPDKLQLGKSY